jgi:hypothetical protein
MMILSGKKTWELLLSRYARQGTDRPNPDGVGTVLGIPELTSTFAQTDAYHADANKSWWACARGKPVWMSKL